MWKARIHHTGAAGCSAVLTSENCMECICIRHTELPNTSKLFADFVYHFDRVSSYYAHSAFDPAGYATAASKVDLPADRRAALVRALRIRKADSESPRRLPTPG